MFRLEVVASEDKRMTATVQRMTRNLLVAVGALAIASFLMLGCEFFPESTFQLASDSRLPKWITLPPGSTRANVSLTMSYYILPWERIAQFTLEDANKHVVEKVNAKVSCSEPFSMTKTGEGFYGRLSGLRSNHRRGQNRND